MGLKMFDFIEDSIKHLEQLNDNLEIANKFIEVYFSDIASSYCDGFLNINSRIKSASSLKEKILRNEYYKKYKTPEELLANLSDLIGIRIECRFIEDERKIYKKLKEYFNKSDSEGYSYNECNENIKLNLSGKQPEEQKNGFEIYRIDGVYCFNGININFEVQIKSLVNIFWG